MNTVNKVFSLKRLSRMGEINKTGLNIPIFYHNKYLMKTEFLLQVRLKTSPTSPYAVSTDMLFK